MLEANEPITIAALFVARDGVYWDVPGIDAWDESRDARLYDGPHPVVAHPPCARWCRLAKFVESQHPNLIVGDDRGCFSSALSSVRKWGGVLEHPAWSMAWAAHGLIAPNKSGWILTIDGDWVCQVSQSSYGHRARKDTWLLYRGDEPPTPMNLIQVKTNAVVGSCSRRSDGSVWRKKVERLSVKERNATPIQFRDALIALARRSRHA